MTVFLKDWENHLRVYRPYLLSFAYRMTGSLAEADDIVQETFLECANVDPSAISNPKAWLTKVCSNKGLDFLKTAYRKRESYRGPWLPDAIPDSLQIWESLSTGASVDKSLLLAESLTTSFLLMIERLTPEERVVYLLAEVFDHPFQTIAAYLDKSEAACRKIAERARKAVLEGRPKFDPGTGKAEELIREFFERAKNGDAAGLRELMADQSEFWSDGGGKVAASPAVIRDPKMIAAFFLSRGLARIFHSEEVRLEFTPVSGRPGLIMSQKLPSGEWEMETLLSFEVSQGKIARIYAQRNPDKIKSLGGLPS